MFWYNQPIETKKQSTKILRKNAEMQTRVLNQEQLVHKNDQDRF